MLALVSVTIVNSAPAFEVTLRRGPLAAVKIFNKTFGTFLWQTAVMYIAFGAADYFLQKRDFLNAVKMTDEELRKDTKETEGDITVKMHIRHLGRHLVERNTGTTPESSRQKMS